MNLEIIEYTPERKPDIVRLISELQDALKALAPDTIASGEKAGVIYTEDLLQTVAKDSGVIYLAFVDEAVVGCIFAYLKRPEDEEVENLYISDIVVTAAYQGKGIGKQLLAKVEVYAKEHGIRYLRIAALSANKGAIRLYKDVGFADFGVTLQKKL